MPDANGSVTPSVAAAATAASTAFPPRRRTSRPTAVAVGSTVATAPPYPIAVGSRSAAACADTGAVSRPSAATEASAIVRRNRIVPPELGGNGPPLPSAEHRAAQPLAHDQPPAAPRRGGQPARGAEPVQALADDRLTVPGVIRQ